MPISEAEWEAGEVGADRSDPRTSPVGEYETERDLVVAFLGENVDNAYTKAEIVKGVDYGELDDPDRVTEDLGYMNPAERLVDVVGDLTASATVVDDVDEALAELVEEGVVVTKGVDRDGESVTYYRLAGDTS